MQMNTGNKPVVLVLAGHDPSGGAGIQADIESVAVNGGHAVTVITSLTAQNTSEFRRSIPVQPADFREQIKLLRQDLPVGACKIGLIASEDILMEIDTVLAELGDIPVVLDPVINAGTGDEIMSTHLRTLLCAKLLPKATIITPNGMEARMLSGQIDLDLAGHALLRQGCHAVLITGTDENTDQVINTLYLNHEAPLRYRWERLPGVYHGSGCTLSSALATKLALGESLHQAVTAAQEFTWQALKSGTTLGKGQLHPNRFYSK